MIAKTGLRRAILAVDDTPRGAVARQWLGAHRAYLAEFKPVDGKPAVYVCENFICQRPVWVCTVLMIGKLGNLPGYSPD